jgi:hypothetical protein
VALLRADPDLILSLVKGRALIPYDQIDNPFLNASKAGP